MKKLSVCLFLVLVGLGFGCLEKPSGKPGDFSGTLYRHHFAGTAQLAQGTNTAQFNKILALPASAEWRGVVLQKLSKSPYELWGKALSGAATDQAALFLPLLDDLVSAESHVEMRGPIGRAELAVAVRLSEERARLWNTNLWQVLSAWRVGQPSAVTAGAARGWAFQAGARTVQFMRAGDWVLVGLGQDRLALLPPLLAKMSQGGRPVAALGKSFLELEANLPHLSAWFPVLADYKLPPVNLSIMGKGDYLRTEARLLYAQPVPWKFEPWRIPTNLIRDPLISFTVGQGLAPVLAQVKGLEELKLPGYPNQFCLWGQSHPLAMTYMTVPMANPSNVLRQASSGLPKFIKTHFEGQPGNFLWSAERSQFIWGGMPFVGPYLHPVREGGTDYILMGLYPRLVRTNLPPPELFAQFMGRKDLLYYDWELTTERLLHARQFYQMTDMVDHRRLASTNTPSQKWLYALVPLLGNTSTEVTMTGPRELTLVRRSNSGFTGFELVTFARWADTPGFPFKFELPPVPKPKPGTNAPPRIPLRAKPATNPPPATAPVKVQGK